MIIILIMAFLPADFMFQTHEDTHGHSPSTSLNILPCFPHQDFHAVGPIVVKRSMSFSNSHKCEDGHIHGDDDLSDDGSNGGSEKKRRLGTEQVRALEKSFELGNKLEPERKTQLARALGLQPRQVAIWFQNRRARWKTKQLERDYDILKKKYEAVKAENDRLQSCNKKLDEELLALRSKESPGYETINIKKETDQRSWSNGSENSSDRNLDLSTTQTQITKFVTASPKSFTSKNFFPASLNIRPASLSQLFQSSSRLDHHVAPKLDQIIHEENLCNVFTGIDDQHGLWPWMEQHHFH